jgi:hydroxypyruvate isomerase
MDTAPVAHPSLRYSANLSMLYPALPYVERPYAAAADGFAYVESWWPFDVPAPALERVEEFCAAIAAAGVDLVALNLYAGDPQAGDRGVLSDPALDLEIWENLKIATRILQRTGCRLVNALHGNRVPGEREDVDDGIGLRRLVRIADQLAPYEVTVLAETLNSVDSPAFPLVDIEHTAELVAKANELSAAANIGLLLDVYHLATMGADPVAAIRTHADLVKHVQLADAPGRGRPGTGDIDFAAIETVLTEVGYDGFVGLEYHPESKQAANTLTLPRSTP